MAVPNFGSIILGGNVFGWTVFRDDAFTLLDAYIDKGGRAIDTADAYPATAARRSGTTATCSGCRSRASAP